MIRVARTAKSMKTRRKVRESVPTEAPRVQSLQCAVVRGRDSSSSRAIEQPSGRRTSTTCFTPPFAPQLAGITRAQRNCRSAYGVGATRSECDHATTTRLCGRIAFSEALQKHFRQAANHHGVSWRPAPHLPGPVLHRSSTSSPTRRGRAKRRLRTQSYRCCREAADACKPSGSPHARPENLPPMLASPSHSGGI